MPIFLVQFNYAPRSIKTMVSQPEVDRAAEAAAMVTSLGGKLLGHWFALGEFDGVVLVDAPDSSTAASITIAIGGTGAVSRLQTTVLLTMAEEQQARRRAATASHLPLGDQQTP